MKYCSVFSLLLVLVGGVLSGVPGTTLADLDSYNQAVNPRSTIASGGQRRLVEPEDLVVRAATRQAVSTAQIREAIITGGSRRGWKIDDGDGPSTLIADLHVRTHYLSVTIDYNEERIRFRYRDSVNMKYDIDLDGSRLIHRKYMGWLNNLRSDIQSQLIRLR